MGREKATRAGALPLPFQFLAAWVGVWVKYEAIGADVLDGVGAIVAATAIYGFFEHGPDSTGVAEHRSVTLAPLFGPEGTGLALGGRF